MRRLIINFIVILFLFIFKTSLYSQEIQNARFEQKDEIIFIHYQLKGIREQVYTIDEVILKKQSDPLFKLLPKNLAGDIGEGKFAGENRTITWHVNEKEQEVLANCSNTEDFYFTINFSSVKPGTPWYYYVGGAALLGGGTAAYFLLKGKDETIINNKVIPDAPGRP